jgi:hypothetical protein
VIVVPNNYQVVNLCFRHGLLVALSESSRNLPNRRQLTVWRVNSSTSIRHLVDLPIAGNEHHNRKTDVAMDEHYIAIFLQMKKCTNINFVSTKSLIVEDSRTVDATEGHILRYHLGLLITKNGNCIG